MQGAIPDVFDDLDIGVTVHDPGTGAIVGINDRVEDIYEYTPAQLREMDIDEYSINLVTQAEIDGIVRDAAAGKSQEVEWHVERGDGAEIWVRVSFASTTLDSEEVVVAEHRDVTDRKEQIQTLQTREAALRHLNRTVATSAPVEDRLSDLLSFGREYFGVEQGVFTRIADGTQEVKVSVGPHEQLQPGETAPLGESYCRHTIESEGTVLVENASEEGWEDDPAFERFGLACYAGTTVTVEGEPYGTICFADRNPPRSGFTESEQTFLELVAAWAGYELERRERERQYERLAERISAGYFALDTDWTITYWNDTIAQRQELPAAEVLGETLWDVWPEIENAVVGQTLQEAMESTEQRTCEFADEHAWTQLRIYPDENGLSVLATDISERKQREQRLTLLHDATRKLVRADSRQEIADILSDTASKTLGFSIHGVNFYDEAAGGLAPAAISEAAQELFGEAPVLDSGLGWEAYQDGEIRLFNDLSQIEEVYNPETPLESEMYFPLGDHGLFLTGSTEADAFDATDLTLTKILTANAESALDRVAKEQQYRRLTERIPSGYYAFDTDWQVTYWNDTMAQRQDIPAEEIIGEVIWDVFPEIEDTEFGETLREAMATGEPQSIEFYMDPDEYWVKAEIYPDDDGLVVLSTDITDQKEYEQELERSNERLEQFAYVASHDLREPLRTIANYIELVAEEYGDQLDDEAHEFIDTVVTSSERMRSMLKGLLEYSRVTTRGDPFEPVDTDQLVGDITEDVGFMIEEHDGTVQWEELPTVEGDRSQLRQVFQNLVTNALEHGGEDGVTIDITATETDDEYQFAVEDNGTGIAPNRQEKIFRIFKSSEQDQTTEEVRGIGLAICENIVSRHGGEIWVDAEPGEGSRFTFTIAK